MLAAFWASAPLIALERKKEKGGTHNSVSGGESEEVVVLQWWANDPESPASDQSGVDRCSKNPNSYILSDRYSCSADFYGLCKQSS